MSEAHKKVKNYFNALFGNNMNGFKNKLKNYWIKYLLELRV